MAAPGNEVFGPVPLAGVCGWPVAHSLSPRLHGFWLKTYGLPGAYLPFAVRPERLEAAIRGLPALGFRGMNVTLPHKEAVLGFVDAIEPQARRVGAINTLVVRADGRIEGRNTDGFGFLASLRAGAPGWQAEAGPAVVLGAGGAARSVLTALLDAGTREIRLINRTGERAQALAADLGDPHVHPIDWAERADALERASLLINTTSLGMTGKAPLDLALDRLPAAAVVTDIVYVPLETELLAQARRRGHVAVDGLGMLLHQAVPGFEAWFGLRPEVTPALRAHLLARL